MITEIVSVDWFPKPIVHGDYFTLSVTIRNNHTAPVSVMVDAHQTLFIVKQVGEAQSIPAGGEWTFSGSNFFTQPPDPNTVELRVYAFNSTTYQWDWDIFPAPSIIIPTEEYIPPVQGWVPVVDGTPLTVPFAASTEGWVPVVDGTPLTVPFAASTEGWVPVVEGTPLIVNILAPPPPPNGNGLPAPFDWSKATPWVLAGGAGLIVLGVMSGKKKS